MLSPQNDKLLIQPVVIPKDYLYDAVLSSISLCKYNCSVSDLSSNFIHGYDLNQNCYRIQ